MAVFLGPEDGVTVKCFDTKVNAARISLSCQITFVKIYSPVVGRLSGDIGGLRYLNFRYVPGIFRKQGDALIYRQSFF